MALLGVVLALVLLVGVAVAVWLFVPAFQGRDAARRDLGTHRLAIGAVVTVLVLNAVFTLPFASALRTDGVLNSRTFALATAATQIPMLLIIYLRLVRPGAMTWSDLGLRPLPLDYALRMGLGAGVVGLIVTQVLGNVLSRFGLQPNQVEQFAFVRTEGVLAFILLLVAAGVLAPCIEELFFRGFLFGTYRARYAAPIAYLGSGVLFTALHLEPTRMNVAQMAGLSVGIFLLAMMLTWLYQHTGSLYPSILAHALNNGTGLLLYYALNVR